MRVSECLVPFGDPEPVSRYLVRLWVRGKGARDGWLTSDWWLDDVTNAEEAIDWARERSADSPSEVLLVDDSGEPRRIWGAEPVDASTTVEIALTR